MTKVKPQRIEANNSPQVGYVPKYVDEQTFEWWAGSGGWGNIIFVSENFPSWLDANDTYTHNLNVTQADVEAGRYNIRITAWSLSNFGKTSASVRYDYTFEQHRWLSTAPSQWDVNRQANTIRIWINQWTADRNHRFIIEDLWAVTWLSGDISKWILISRDTATASWAVTYTHDLWRIPNTIKLSWWHTEISCNGYYNSTTQLSLCQDVSNNYTSNSNFITYYQGWLECLSWIITNVSSTEFTITRTKVNDVGHTLDFIVTFE